MQESDKNVTIMSKNNGTLSQLRAKSAIKEKPILNFQIILNPEITDSFKKLRHMTKSDII